MIHIDHIAVFGLWLEIVQILFLVIVLGLAYFLIKCVIERGEKIMPRGRTSMSTGQEAPHENHDHGFDVDNVGSGKTIPDKTGHIHLIEGWHIEGAGAGRGAHSHIITDQPMM